MEASRLGIKKWLQKRGGRESGRHAPARIWDWGGLWGFLAWHLKADAAQGPAFLISTDVEADHGPAGQQAERFERRRLPGRITAGTWA